MILIQCHGFGLGKKIFEPSLKQLALQYVYHLLDFKIYATFYSLLNLFIICCQSLKLLSVMAAIRLDNNVDNIENTLSSSLVDTKSNAAVTDRSITTFDPLASSTWEQVKSCSC